MFMLEHRGRRGGRWLVLAILFWAIHQGKALPAPGIQWTSIARNTNTLGSANRVREVAVDAAGNTYVAADVGSDGAILFGTYKVASKSSPADLEVVVAKMDPAGNWLWATNHGSATQFGCEPNALTVDAAGNCYVAGYFKNYSYDISGKPYPLWGTTNVQLGAGNLLSSDGYNKAFVAKFSAAGQCQWVRGARTGLSTAYAVAVAPNGNVSLGGTFGRTLALGTPVSASYQYSVTNNYNANSVDSFAATYDANGNFLWAAVGNGINPDAVVSMAADSQNRLTVAGLFSGTNTFAGGTLVNTNSLMMVYLTQFDAAGTVLWSRKLPGTTSDNYLFSSTGFVNNGRNTRVHVRVAPDDSLVLAAEQQISGTSGTFAAEGFTFDYWVLDFGNGIIRSNAQNNSIWILTLTAGGLVSNAAPVASTYVYAPLPINSFTISTNQHALVSVGDGQGLSAETRHTNGVYWTGRYAPTTAAVLTNLMRFTFTGDTNFLRLDWTQGISATRNGEFYGSAVMTLDGAAEFGGVLVGTNDFGTGTLVAPSAGATGHDLFFGRFLPAPVAPYFNGAVSFVGDKLNYNIAGFAGQQYVLQASTNLATWIPVQTNTLSAPSVSVTNSISAGVTRQFYRILLP